MSPNIMELAEQIVSKNKIEKHEDNQIQHLCDKVSNIEKILAKLSADNTNKLDSLLIALKNSRNSTSN